MKIDETVLDVLERLFVECGSFRAATEAAKFRVNNYKDIKIIDWLENEQYIQRDEHYYDFKLVSLYLITDPYSKAKDLIQQCEAIFPHLKKHYLKFTCSPLAVAKMRGQAKIGTLSPMGKSEYVMLCVGSFFKGVTINKKSRLDHDLLRLPETRSFKWLGYRPLPKYFQNLITNTKRWLFIVRYLNTIDSNALTL